MVRVFCDFDGTVCQTDVGRTLFKTFVGEAKAGEIVQRYFSGEISARESLRRECSAVAPLPVSRLEAFVDQFSVDRFFRPFVDFCRAAEIPVMILSDGLDFYVERILHAGGLGHLPWYANHLELKKEGDLVRLEVSFPYADSECEQCGNCKRNHILTGSADEDIIVYVGDGISDRCPIRYADVVFAKSGLIQYCQQANISYFDFEHFGDVQSRLGTLLRDRRLKKRREAEMARRDLFMQG